ncbi:MAG: hypothetical protein IK134_01815 [Oscillospiraceae bacterium]|nr:hypothetical protein [Oscillospiraceae bacterium]
MKNQNMESLLHAECRKFLPLLCIIVLAAVVLSQTFCGLSFHLYHVLAVLIGLYPLFSYCRSGCGTTDQIRVYMLLVAGMSVLLMLTVCLIPGEDTIYLMRDSMFRISLIAVAVEHGYIEFGPLETHTHFALLLGLTAILIPAVYLPVMLRKGAKAGSFAAGAGVLLAVCMHLLFRFDYMCSGFLTDLKATLLLPAILIVGMFVYSCNAAAASCLNQKAVRQETEVQT